MSEMCCPLKMLDEQITQKIAICAPLHNFVGLYLGNEGMYQYQQSGKYFLNSNISSTCAHNMVNFGPLTAKIGLGVWGTVSKFQRVSRLGSVTAQHSSGR